MSDKPEPIFSIAGNTPNPMTRCLKDDTVQEILVLRSWQDSGLINLDRRLFNKAVAAAEAFSINDDHALNESDDETTV
jgi:hypothetical protein